MKKTVILSTNNNPDYLNYLPYVQKAWNKLGWETLTFTHGITISTKDPKNKTIDVTFAGGDYRPETVVQCIRLLGHRFTDGFIMTSDVDMMPCSDYWHPNENKLTVYGFDLTGRSQYPICYIAMKSEYWEKIIPEETLPELLDKYPNAKSEHWETWWTVDQQIITERINVNANPESIDLIDRGFTNGLAKGRIDRADWERTLNAPGEKIDAHMLRPFNQIEGREF